MSAAPLPLSFICHSSIMLAGACPAQRWQHRSMNEKNFLRWQKLRIACVNQAAIRESIGPAGHNPALWAQIREVLPLEFRLVCSGAGTPAAIAAVSCRGAECRWVPDRAGWPCFSPLSGLRAGPGVGSSEVIHNCLPPRMLFSMPRRPAADAGVAKLVDAPDLGSGIARCGGSSPFARTSAPGPDHVRRHLNSAEESV